MLGFRKKDKPLSQAEARCSFDDAIHVAITAAQRYGVPSAEISSMLKHFASDIDRRIEMAREAHNYRTDNLHIVANLD